MAPNAARRRRPAGSVASAMIATPAADKPASDHHHVGSESRSTQARGTGIPPVSIPFGPAQPPPNTPI